MSTRRFLSKIYRGSLRFFIYNKINQAIFFPKGCAKKINGEVIKLPFRYWWFYPKIYEPEKTELIHSVCKPGDTAIDIGAHIGIFSFFLAKQVGRDGRVYSFEPAPYIFNIFLETIKYNASMKVVNARQQAVVSRNGELPFTIYRNSKVSNANSIYSRNLEDRYDTITVKTTCLDELLNEPIKNLSFIKIDAEGAELEIFKGAQTIIGKYKPVIALEVHPKSFEDSKKALNELYNLIKRSGYNIYRHNEELGESDFCDVTSYFEVILKPKTFG